MKHSIDHYLSKEDLLQVSDTISNCELKTSGEICISIKEKTPFLLKNKSVKELAIKEFFRMNIDKTRDHTGILIFLQLDKKQFFILADKGINEKVPQSKWDSISTEIQSIFKNGNFKDGLIFGIKEISEVLAEHFPRKSDDSNELSNNIEIN